MISNKPKRPGRSGIKPGDKFGHLTALYECEERYITKGGSSYVKWHCVCDCEDKNEVDVRSSDLKSGNTQSCGCLWRKRFIEGGEKTRFKSNSSFIENGKNIYDLSGKYGIGKTSNGDEFYFDLEDYNKIKDFLWETSISKSTNSQRKYVTSQKKGKVYYLHRVILDLPDRKNDIEKRDVDHINHKTLDNRKENLRICKRHENTTSKILSIHNKSGRKGVFWDKERNKWIAQIGYKNKQIRLGRFDNFDDAVKAREEAEKKYHGEFTYLG